MALLRHLHIIPLWISSLDVVDSNGCSEVTISHYSVDIDD